MRIKATDRIGQKYGKLLVLSIAGQNKNHVALLKCVCDCGNTTIINSGNITNGNTRSCGCGRTKHGLAKQHQIHGAYQAWASMRNRCNNMNNKDFRHYGGRGIKACPQWDDFSVFLADMGERPEGMSLDRIDNDNGYSPENCRWATSHEQSSNRRNSIHITHNGEALALREWAAVTGIAYVTLYSRYRAGRRGECLLRKYMETI